jgi:hypothetical protein
VGWARNYAVICVIAYQKLETVEPAPDMATFTVKNPDCGG